MIRGLEESSMLSTGTTAVESLVGELEVYLRRVEEAEGEIARLAAMLAHPRGVTGGQWPPYLPGYMGESHLSPLPFPLRGKRGIRCRSSGASGFRVLCRELRLQLGETFLQLPLFLPAGGHVANEGGGAEQVPGLIANEEDGKLDGEPPAVTA